MVDELESMFGRSCRTYSRAKRKHAPGADDAFKRRRVEDDYHTSKSCRHTSINQGDCGMPSSDGSYRSDLSSDPAIVFDDDRRPSTPPSSPPPVFRDETTLCNDVPPLPVQAEPLTVVSEAGMNARNTLKGSSAQTIKPVSKSRLVQMQLNLGLQTEKTCKTCGMTYTPSNLEDSLLHSRFHERQQRHQHGVEVGKALRAKEEQTAVLKRPNGDIVVRIDSSARWQTKRTARKILDIAQAELGAVEIPDAELWSTTSIRPVATNASPSPANHDGQKQTSVKECSRPRYNLYLYLSGLKCVGLCLAERIKAGYKVIGPNDDVSGAEHAALEIAEEMSPAAVGISRIWISKSQRRKGIATALLDSVCLQFDDVKAVPKSMVAFSQPTTSGTSLARKWFKKADGWLVYRD